MMFDRFWSRCQSSDGSALTSLFLAENHMQSHKLIYKIIDKAQWTTAEAAGVFEGASIDLNDGYIHFSTAEQSKETAGKHFAGQSDLLLVAVSVAPLGDALKWEPSRGGDLFPHLYGSLKTGDAVWVKELPLDENGIHVFPVEFSKADS